MDRDFEHESVLLDDVVDMLDPKDGGLYCDGTLGGGGHSEAILERSAPGGRLIGIDRDINAVKAARERLSRFGDRVRIVHGRFSEMGKILEELGETEVDGFLLDLGVSSHQLDVAARGFSFMNAGPLDMRMDSSSGETAKELLSNLSEADLADVIYRFGEERMSRKIARSIKQMEQAGELNSTADLAVAVQKVIRHRPGRSHPATRTFQAIRIAVNREMDELEAVLDALPSPLAMDGTAVIITFHSLEDRMVKRHFKELVDPCKCPPNMPVCNCPSPTAEFVTRRRVRVSENEKNKNRRSRSATARAIRRIR